MRYIRVFFEKGATETTNTGSAEATAAVQGHSGSPASTADHVADFYGAYTNTLHDVGHGRLTDALRRHCLTWTRVTLTWNETSKQQHTTHLVIRSDLATRLISGIRADG